MSGGGYASVGCCRGSDDIDRFAGMGLTYAALEVVQGVFGFDRGIWLVGAGLKLNAPLPVSDNGLRDAARGGGRESIGEEVDDDLSSDVPVDAGVEVAVAFGVLFLDFSGEDDAEEDVDWFETFGVPTTGRDNPRSFPRLATPTPHVSCVLYPAQSFPSLRHWVQYGRRRSHGMFRLEQVKQSAEAPAAGALFVAFAAPGTDPARFVPRSRRQVAERTSSMSEVVSPRCSERDETQADGIICVAKWVPQYSTWPKAQCGGRRMVAMR